MNLVTHAYTVSGKENIPSKRLLLLMLLSDGSSYGVCVWHVSGLFCRVSSAVTVLLCYSCTDIVFTLRVTRQIPYCVMIISSYFTWSRKWARFSLYTHAHTHTHTHTWTHTHTHTRARACVCAHIFPHTLTNTCIHTHTHTENTLSMSNTWRTHRQWINYTVLL